MREEEDFAYTRPAFDVAAIAAQLRAAARAGVRRHQQNTLTGDDARAAFGHSVQALANLPPLPPIALQPEFDATARAYHVNELLAFHDAEFVRNAYRALLRREPDQAGATALLAALRGGQVNKLDVLAQLAASDEAQTQAVQLEGLGARARLRRFYRVPVIGYALRLMIGILRLPQQQSYLQQLEAHLIAQQERLADYANVLRKQQAAQTERAAAALNAGETVQRGAIETARKELNALRDEQRQLITNARDEQRRDIAAARAAFDARLMEAQSEIELQAQLAQLRNEFSAAQQAEQAQTLEQIKVSAATLRQQLLQLEERHVAAVSDLQRDADARAADVRRHGDARVDELHWHTDARIDNLQKHGDTQIEKLQKHNDVRVDELQQHVETLIGEQAQTAAQFQREREARQRAMTDELRSAVEKVYLKQQELRAEFAQQGRQLNLIFESVDAQAAQARTAEDAAHLLPDAVQRVRDEARHTLDAFYIALEDHLRGSRETIRERLKVYLPIIRAAGAGGNPARPVLDLGCGRGEWLELLREEELTGRGIDTNRLSIADARAQGLNVEEADLLAHLRALPDASVGAVTCFHVVEHLPLETVLKVMEEVWRVLSLGGVAIFETPNPRNVLVGSCNFYYDPTHRNPVPAEVLQYIVESRGFGEVEILPLNPSDAEPIQSDDETARRFNALFYGAMDYAVIARKPKI